MTSESVISQFPGYVIGVPEPAPARPAERPVPKPPSDPAVAVKVAAAKAAAHRAAMQKKRDELIGKTLLTAAAGLTMAIGAGIIALGIGASGSFNPTSWLSVNWPAVASRFDQCAASHPGTGAAVCLASLRTTSPGGLVGGYEIHRKGRVTTVVQYVVDPAPVVPAATAVKRGAVARPVPPAATDDAVGPARPTSVPTPVAGQPTPAGGSGGGGHDD